jgi:hypothetical protein
MKQPNGNAATAKLGAAASKASVDARLSAAAALGGNVVHGVAALSAELDEYVDENCRSGPLPPPAIAAVAIDRC